MDQRELLHMVREINPQKVPDWRSYTTPKKTQDEAIFEGAALGFHPALVPRSRRRLVGLISVQRIPPRSGITANNGGPDDLLRTGRGDRS